MAIVYRHIRLDKNEVFYIGIGRDEKRAYNKNSRNNYWKHIVSKTNYEIEILFDDLTWGQACEKEKEFIKLYGRKDLGTGTLVNMMDGGEGSINRTPWNKNKKMTEDFKNFYYIKNKIKSDKELERLRNINPRKKVLQFNLNNIFIEEYYSINEASRKTNIPTGNISRSCRNNTTAGGFRFKFN